MAEEHLHCLCIIFDWFREHNLKLKPCKCDFFRNEITYLAHQVLKDGVCPSNLNLENNCRMYPPQTYMQVQAFLSLVGHYMRFIKVFAHISQPLSEYLTGEGASRKSERVSPRMPWKPSKHWNRCAWQLPYWCLLTTLNHSCWETYASKDGLGALLSQKQADVWYHPIAYGSRALTPHKKNYHSTKLEFLALKWAVREHFKEYLPYQSFVVSADNYLLTYIMSTPYLDAMGHQWVGTLAQFSFELEYQKGHDNMVADILGQVTTQLNLETVKSILDGVAIGTAHPAKVHNLAMVEGDQYLEQEVCVATGFPLVELHIIDWAEAQREDPMLSTVLDWLKAQKQTDLKMLLVEHASSEEVNWSYGIDRISQFIREPCIYA